MWCTHCQQDIPAVARSAQGPLLCSQCEHEVATPGPVNRPADTGVPLDLFDAPSATAEQDLAPPSSDLERDQANQRLRRIGRQLRSTPRLSIEVGTSPVLSTAVDSPQPRVKATYLRPSSATKHNGASWLISSLIFLGVSSFGLGLGLLTWSAAFQLPRQWQWGMTATIMAEGFLVLGLTWMAVRLWRNSRQVNRQLVGVDRQLHEIQELTGTLAGSQPSSSQYFYRHFNQAASPQLMAANLRGQVDHLADRLAS